MSSVTTRQQAMIEIDRCDRKIVEMLGRRALAIRTLSRANQGRDKKILASDTYVEQMSKLHLVAETYSAPLDQVKPIMSNLYNVFEAYEVYKQWKV